jgi:hypothetical protein
MTIDYTPEAARYIRKAKSPRPSTQRKGGSRGIRGLGNLVIWQVVIKSGSKVKITAKQTQYREKARGLQRGRLPSNQTQQKSKRL